MLSIFDSEGPDLHDFQVKVRLNMRYFLSIIIWARLFKTNNVVN